jgi:protein TonB
MNLRSLSTLQWALGVSLAVHAVLLSVRFVNPEAFHRAFKDTPLEVILVNARSQDHSEKAQAIAQANLAGGGDALQGLATSPTPSDMMTYQGQDNEDALQHQISALEEQQRQILTQIRGSIAALARANSQPGTPTSVPAQQTRKERQLMQLLAEIERRVQLENARPKKHYVSPSTREAVYAVYYDHLRSTIEKKGTENFPQVNGQKLYGELIMSITVNSKGQVVETRIEQRSGVRALDRYAQVIVRSAAPFGHFNKAMRHQSDQIVVISRFKFTRDETLDIKTQP